MVALLAQGGQYFDPVWRIGVELTESEQAVLAHPDVRRLFYVAHAGAASIMSAQTYSRLEHSLGLLALVAHFRPRDVTMRLAALTHDIGHLPLSHTLENTLGVDHHAIGQEKLRRLSGCFTRADPTVAEIVEATSGSGRSALGGAAANMNLDHFESFVRSAHVHGRTSESPRSTLEAVSLVDGSVSCDADTAQYLTRLVLEEADRQTSPHNAAVNAATRSLVERALQSRPSPTVSQIIEMTDAELWSWLETIPDLAHETKLLRLQPDRWSAERIDAGAQFPDGACEYVIARLYLDVPLVGGMDYRLAGEDSDRAKRLARRFAVHWPSP